MKIEEIKAQLSMERVLSHYALKVSPNNHLHCPFHDDKTPSMKLFRETNTVYCFSGNCERGGKSIDVIDFVMYMEGCNKHEAIMKCKELLGWVKPVDGSLPPSILPRIWEDLKGVYKRSGKKVKEYVKRRGLEGLELGYNHGKWHLHPKRTAEENAQALSEGFLQTPLKSDHKYSVWARNTLMFALRDRVGEVVSLYGRVIEEQAGRTKHFYMKGGARGGLYPKYPSAECRRLILTESVIDAASLLQMKSITERYEVLALYGVRSFGRTHCTTLSALKDLEEVFVMLDGDEAGRKGNKKIGQELMKWLPKASIRVVEMPEGMDVNEIWVNHESEAPLIELLQTARTLQEHRPAAT